MKGNAPQCEKMYFITDAPNEDFNQPVYLCSMVRVFFVRMKDHCLFMKILIRLRNAHADLNLDWAHTFGGMFSDVAAQIYEHEND